MQNMKESEESLLKICKEKAEWCLQTFRRYYGLNFDLPRIYRTYASLSPYRNGMKWDGAAYHAEDTIGIDANVKSREQLEVIVAHEMAHILDFRLRGVSSHTGFWRELMLLFGENAEVERYDRDAAFGTYL